MPNSSESPKGCLYEIVARRGNGLWIRVKAPEETRHRTWRAFTHPWRWRTASAPFRAAARMSYHVLLQSRCRKNKCAVHGTTSAPDHKHWRAVGACRSSAHEPSLNSSTPLSLDSTNRTKPTQHNRTPSHATHKPTHDQPSQSQSNPRVAT